MKRIVYRVIFCSEQENQDGTFHCSPDFAMEKEARKFAESRNDTWVVLEKHWQIRNGYKWSPDFDHGETSIIVDYL